MMWFEGHPPAFPQNNIPDGVEFNPFKNFNDEQRKAWEREMRIKKNTEIQMEKCLEKVTGIEKVIMTNIERRKIERNERVEQKRKLWQKDMDELRECYKKMNIFQEDTLKQVEFIAKETNSTNGQSVDNCYTLDDINEEIKGLH
jgi:hypothetical protein